MIVLWWIRVAVFWLLVLPYMFGFVVLVWATVLLGVAGIVLWALMRNIIGARHRVTRGKNLPR